MARGYWLALTTTSSLGFALVGCFSSDDRLFQVDGGEVIDAARPRDSGTPYGDADIDTGDASFLTWVDFSAYGCSRGESLDGAGSRHPLCSGTVPLKVGFVAIAPTTIASYRWRFGDENVATGANLSAEAHPVYHYELPGRYTVQLEVAGSGGTTSHRKDSFIEVRHGGLSSACSRDEQCVSGYCECKNGSCADVAGFCTIVGCATSRCENLRGECVHLMSTAMSMPSPAWRTDLCLASCNETGQVCPAGTTCQAYPSSFPRAGLGARGEFRFACFATGVFADFGQSCFNAEGQADDSRCASGYCAPLGARGLCTARCTANSCPVGTGCATFRGSLDSLCLAECVSSQECSNDPWLACRAAGGEGDLSFFFETAATTRYWAPKSCMNGSDCGAEGSAACIAGFCAEAN